MLLIHPQLPSLLHPKPRHPIPPRPLYPQIKAIKYIVRGRSVVVSAPTGSGKTAIAEACMRHFLGAGRRIIYTTPLKALSNQKLVEMRQRFGCGPRLLAIPAGPRAGLGEGDAHPRWLTAAIGATCDPLHWWMVLLRAVCWESFCRERCASGTVLSLHTGWRRWGCRPGTPA